MNDYKKDWPKHAPPAKLWFQYHPNPGTYGPDSNAEDDCIPSDKGDLWHDAFYSEEEAIESLNNHDTHDDDTGESISLKQDGWQVEEYVHKSEVDKLRAEIEELKAGLSLRGLVLKGWTCLNCHGFNGELKNDREKCRACGADKPNEFMRKLSNMGKTEV